MGHEVSWSLASVLGSPGLPLDPAPPVDIGRDAAARAAREELTRGIYHRDDPGVVSRVLAWAQDVLVRLFDAIAAHSPGGVWGLLALALVVALAVVVVRWRVGALARSGSVAGAPVFAGQALSASEHRRAADAAAAAGEYETACRERFRAVVRELEERAVLDERPGRTAGEVVAETTALAPAVAAPLRAAARVFDEVSYGGRPGSAAADARLRTADDAVRDLRRSAAAPLAVPS